MHSTALLLLSDLAYVSVPVMQGGCKCCVRAATSTLCLWDAAGTVVPRHSFDILIDFIKLAIAATSSACCCARPFVSTLTMMVCHALAISFASLRLEKAWMFSTKLSAPLLARPCMRGSSQLNGKGRPAAPGCELHSAPIVAWVAVNVVSDTFVYTFSSFFPGDSSEARRERA